MKPRNNMSRLQRERQRLESRQKELELALQSDWEEVQEGVRSGQFIREAVKGFFIRKIYNSDMAGDAFVAGTAHIAMELAEKAENFLVQKLEVFINKIAQKVASWFGQKSAPEEDEPVEETAI
jgi:hypothetical protein